MKFQNLLKPATAEEALAYAKLPNTVVLGGGMWVRMMKKKYDNAVDLSLLGLDKIEKTGNGFKIGAYVTLRQLETDEGLLAYTHGAVSTAFEPIVGVQFRNGATVGGSIFGRFGFSDVTTLFCALGATLVFAEEGEMPIMNYVSKGASKGDVLLYILLPKEAPDAAATFAHRHSATDFPLVTCTAVRRGDKMTVAASPAPVRAAAKTFDVNEASAELFCSDMPLKENASDSAVYADRILHVMLSRAILAAGGQKQ